MHPRLARRLIAIVSALALAAVPAVWFVRQYRWADLNHALIVAIYRCDADKVDALLAEGADPNTRATLGNRLAISERMYRAVHPLPRDFEPTAIMDAVCQQKPTAPRIVKALLSKGADVNARYGGLATEPISLISFAEGHAESTEVLELLLAAGAHVDARGWDGDTPLIEAAWFNSPLVRVLIEHGANANAASRTGETPLIMAVSNEQAGNARMLLEHGAKANMPGQGISPSTAPSIIPIADKTRARHHPGSNSIPQLTTKISPLSIARREGYKDIEKLLITYGATE